MAINFLFEALTVLTVVFILYIPRLRHLTKCCIYIISHSLYNNLIR